MILIGIDSGLAHGGVVRWDAGTFTAGKVWTTTKLASGETLSNLDRARRVKQVLSPYIAGANGACVEAMSFPRHASASHKMGIAWGLVAAVVTCPVFVLSPQEVRRLIGVAKGASKADIRLRMLELHPELMDLEPTQTTLWEHLYDAAAVLHAWTLTDTGRFLIQTEAENVPA